MEVAREHYQDLALTSGLTLSQYAAVLSKERGFLGDHEWVARASTMERALTSLQSHRYPFLQHIVGGM